MQNICHSSGSIGHSYETRIRSLPLVEMKRGTVFFFYNLIELKDYSWTET